MERTTLLKPWEMGTFGGGPLWSLKASALEIARTPFPSPRGVQQERGAGAGSLFGGRRPGLGLQLFRLRALPLPLALAPTPASRFARLHVPGSLPSQIPGESSSRAAVLPVPGCGEVGGYAEPAPRSPPRHRSSSRGSAEVRRGGRGRCRDNAGSASGDPGSSPGLTGWAGMKADRGTESTPRGPKPRSPRPERGTRCAVSGARCPARGGRCAERGGAEGGVFPEGD